MVQASPPGRGWAYRYPSAALNNRTWLASATTVSRCWVRRNTPRRTSTMLCVGFGSSAPSAATCAWHWKSTTEMPSDSNKTRRAFCATDAARARNFKRRVVSTRQILWSERRKHYEVVRERVSVGCRRRGGGCHARLGTQAAERCRWRHDRR